MTAMRANIAPIVSDLKKVTIEQVAFEAITNSLQANATHIGVYFYNTPSMLKETEVFVDKIKVIDDGEGFNSENIESFKTYRSTYKHERKIFGAKGIGRFLFLKLFTYVDIKSLSKEITFTVKHDVVEKDTKKNYKKTEVLMHYPVKDHNKSDYKITKNDFEQKIKDHFLPHFKLLETQSKVVKIVIYFNDKKTYTIKSADIPKLTEDFFEIKEHKFILSYLINDQSIRCYDGFYCAGNRVVLKNSQTGSHKFKAFSNVKILFLLSSDYFDKSVNDERDDFNIKPVLPDLVNNLSWRDIHDELSKKIKSICKSRNIDIDKKAQENLKQSIDNAPFLSAYLCSNELGLSSEELIKDAAKRYEDDKETLRTAKDKDTDKYKRKLNLVVQAELAEYIFDREKIINKLKDIVDDNLLEKEVHNLFMKQKTKDSSQNYKTNNVWLFDDRFMAYNKIFSDKEINTIFPELNSVLDRVDICIISNTYDKEKITDIILIEFKRPSQEITPEGAEAQLLRYARYINRTRTENNKMRIWAYAFLKFSSEVESALDDKSYNTIPTHSKYPIRYRYYDKPNIIINFMDYSALAHDAYARNQTFINILKGKQFDN